MIEQEKNEKELEPSSVSSVPFLAPGFGARIDKVSSMFATRTEAAAAGGVSPDMLVKYVGEAAAPKFATLAGIAAKAGVSLDWLATGEGPLKRGFTGGQGGGERRP